MPVDFAEQRARLLEDRAQKAEAERDRLKEMLLDNGFTLADSQYDQTVAKAPWNNGEWDIHLTEKEEKLLNLLYHRQGRTINKEAMLSSLYAHDADWPDIKIIDVFICKIRAKLVGFPGCIETIWGRGYKYIPGQTALRPSDARAAYSPPEIIREILFQREGVWQEMDALSNALSQEPDAPTNTNYRKDVQRSITAIDTWIDRNCPKGSKLERDYTRRGPRKYKVIHALRVVINRG